MEEVKIDGIPIEDYGTPNSRSVYCGEINVGQTIKSNIDFWKEKYFELEKNSVPISLIEKKKEELKNVLDIIKTGKDDFSKGQASALERIIKMFDKELLDERSRNER